MHRKTYNVKQVYKSLTALHISPAAKHNPHCPAGDVGLFLCSFPVRASFEVTAYFQARIDAVTTVQ